MSRYNLINSVLGWITFAIALITYTLTLEPTVSFWDCGEFISASFRLQICHPPGAPLFLMIGRLFSLMAGTDVTQVAFWVNMVSATTSALCIMFYFWTITHLAKKILVKNGEADTQQTVAIMMSGIVGALALTWSDTFWFSAVEAEVYASSSFFTALTFWCILKWENVANERHSDRWLILIAYLIGLAIGVHLLNLLVIPAIVYVYYFKKYAFTQMGFIKATGVAVLAIGIIQFVMIPGIPSLMAKFDLLFVNSFGMGFNAGSYFTLIFLAALLAFGLWYSVKNNKVWLNTAMLCATFIVIGYSSYAMILIRSAANPPIDMNDPEDPFSLSSYINREQYGDNPLVYGQYFYAKVIDYKKGAMQYRAGDGKYEEVGPKVTRIYDPKDCTVLPRMWADRPDYIQAYRQWEKIPEGKRATFGKNMDFMFSYQLGFMYARYFMWNFVGRQSDEQGFGDATKGNWISGIEPFDNWRVGPQQNIPDSMHNKAHNTYYFLPLLLGFLGVIYHFKKSQEDAIVILTLFLFTGAFIVLYLNFPAHQPRERDYAYVGSFQTFFIWVGLGVLAVIDFLSKKMSKMVATSIASVVTLAGVPLILVSQNWDDHDRSVRTTAVDFATNYLESCPKNAILFTNGDNDTYPLWYAQNVEGIRSDVRVINLSLLNTDWYADGLKRQVYESAPVPFSMTPDKYVQGVRDYVMYYNNPAVEKTYGVNQTDFYPLKNIIAFVNDDKDPMAKLSSQGGDQYSYYPTKKFFVKVDKEQALKAGAVHPKDAQFIVDSIKWEIGNGNLLKADLITLDIVASTDWTRPICFAITTGSDVYLNMQNYFQINGLVYQIVPILNTGNNDGTMGRINSDILYENLMTKFKWGGMDKDGVYLDETILRQTKNLRNLFSRLATKLVEEGDTAKAIKVLDRCLEVMPQKNVPYDVFVVRLAEAYYVAGDNAKANLLVKEVAKVYEDKYTYYAQYKKAGKGAQVQEELGEAGQILGYCMQVAQFHKQEDLFKEIKAKMDALQIAM
jgi:positive regulator of sigma E activity